jgi:ATP-dependent DNA ligase
VGTIRLTLAPHPLEILSQSDYAEQNSVDGSDNNVRNTLCGIVLHSTLWLKPEAVAQIEFLEWTGANHLRHTKFVALRDDKDPREVVKEKSNES